MQHNDAAEFFRSRPLVVAPMAGGPSSPELAAVDPTDAWDAKCAALRDAWSADFGPAAVSVTFGLPTPELIAAGHAAGALVLATVADPAAAQKAVALGVDALVVQALCALPPPAAAGPTRSRCGPAPGSLPRRKPPLLRLLTTCCLSLRPLSDLAPSTAAPAEALP